MRYISHSPEETKNIAEKLVGSLGGGEVIAYEGGLGMGKTAFTAGLATGLGITAPVSSPTFTIMQSYQGRLTLYHFDMYRITDEDSLYSTGFFDFVGQPDSITAIEWSENIRDFLPLERIIVSIERGKEDNERIITIKKENQ